MNIYLVNRYSKLKGPFDIIDSNRQHIMKVGDICLRDTERGVEFLVVYNSNNIWSSCKKVGIGNNEILSEIGNTLLFSFDGLSKRKGVIPLIKQLATSYREKVICDFFTNAIDILEYKKDFWDSYLFQRFFVDSQELIEIDKKDISIERRDNIHYPSVFSKYLSNDLLDLLNTKLKEGFGLKESYLVLREKDPKQFRTSLMKFLAENPSGSIYDLQQPSFEYNVNSDEKPQIEAPAQILETTYQGSDVNDVQSFVFYEFDNIKFKHLLQQFRTGDKHAFDIMIKMNLKLVAIIANSYEGFGAEYDDLMQEGVIGLIKAIKRFNPKRNVHFPYYAQWWIHRSIKESLIHLQTTIKIPNNHILLYKKIKKAIELFEQRNGYEPASTEIEIDEAIEPEEIDYFIGLPDCLSQITTSNNEWDEYPSEDLADEIVMKESQSHLVNSLIARLNKREAFILKRLYGIGEKSLSLADIAIQLRITRERVRQIAEKALRIIRNSLILQKGEKSKRKINAKRRRHVSNNSILKSVRPQIIEKKEDKASQSTTNESELKPDIQIGIMEDVDGKYKHADKRPNNLITKVGIGNEPDESNKSIQNNRSLICEETNNNDLEIEHVYVGIPSSEPYHDIDIEQPAKSNHNYKKKHIDTNKIKTVFDKRATSYKFLWMIAILSVIKERGAISISYRDLTIKMASFSWPLIMGNNLDFGPNDRMKTYLIDVQKKSKFIPTASLNVVEKYLIKHFESQRLDKILSPLLKNVPYRFLSPWIKFTTVENVVFVSNSRNYTGPYALHSDGIIFNKDWLEYFKNNYSMIYNFTISSFFEYLKVYNSRLNLVKLKMLIK